MKAFFDLSLSMVSFSPESGLMSIPTPGNSPSVPGAGFHGFHHVDYLLRVFRVQLDIEHINVGEPPEEHIVTFHHRPGGQPYESR